MTSLLPFPGEALQLSAFPKVATLLSHWQKALAQGRFPSTVTLVGEPLGGREALAVELAAALICPKGDIGCQCSHCLRVRHGLHPDFYVLSVGAGHQEIRMEDVTSVLASFRQVPFEGRKRVYLLANAHTPPLNTYAASALLKTLEEPVPHAHWLLLAANPLSMLPTIVSRAVMLRVPSPPPELLAQRLGPQGQELYNRVPASLGAFQDQGQGGEAFLAAARPLLHQAGRGDLLALLRLNALASGNPSQPILLASLALAAASEAQPEEAERWLEMAAAFLRARQLQEHLHVSFEIVALAAVAPSIIRA